MRKSIIPLIAVLGLCLGAPAPGKASVAPVGHLPTVTVSVTPPVYALPVLMVEKEGEWKDFGIQVRVKVHLHGEEQLARSAGNEWEVAVMDPISAVRGGNEGNVAIAGIAGNYATQIPFLSAPRGAPPQPQKWAEWLKGFVARTESRGEKKFFPACLVATSGYADTRKTLVIRWLEGYSRGIQIIGKNPEAAASRLKEFFEGTLKREGPPEFFGQDMRSAFFFDEKDREEPFRGKEGKPSLFEEFAGSMTRYLKGVNALDTQAEPSEYILLKISDQISALRGEAMAQLEKTREAVEDAARAGARVDDFRSLQKDGRRTQANLLVDRWMPERIVGRFALVLSPPQILDGEWNNPIFLEKLSSRVSRGGFFSIAVLLLALQILRLYRMHRGGMFRKSDGAVLAFLGGALLLVFSAVEVHPGFMIAYSLISTFLGLAAGSGGGRTDGLENE